MRFQTKIISATLTVFMISLLFLGVLVFSNYKDDLEEQKENNLLSISKTVENSVDLFLSEQENKIELIATQSDLTDDELKEMILLDESFYDMFVIAPNGTVIRSSNPQRIGLDRKERCYFVNARNHTYTCPVYFALVPQEYSISVSTPFKGGVLVGSMKLETFNKIALARTGLGETGENLMAFINENNEVVYFTERLFSDKKMESIQLKDAEKLPIYPALLGKEEVYKNLLDYRNAEVIAVTAYFEKVKIGLVTKIDRAEAFSSVKELQKTTIFIMLVIIFLVASITYIMIKPISKEMISITSDIDQITKGNLNIQLKKSGIFEIQNLINSLNRILASMKLAILRTGISKEEMGLGEAIKAKESAENKYEELFNNSSDAMFIHDLQGNFLEVNKTACERLGYTREELLKIGPAKIDSPKFSKLVPARIAELKKNGSATFESAHISKSGKEISVEISSRVIQYNGSPAIFSVARDISERKSVNDRYKMLYDDSSDAIMIITPPKWNFTAGNKATIKMFGLKSEKQLASLTPGDLSPKYQPDGKLSSVKAKKMIMKAMKEGKNFFEWTHRKYKKESFSANVLLSKVNIDGTEMLQATVRKVEKRGK